jgi:hypothetical protein
MGRNTKLPPIPTPPIAGKPPVLNIPDNLFEGSPTITGYASRPFTEINNFESYAKELFKSVRLKANGARENAGAIIHH